MTTPYDEGWEAGYKGRSYKNPYAKAIYNAEAVNMEFEWILGYKSGIKQAAIDLADKRANSTK